MPTLHMPCYRYDRNGNLTAYGSNTLRYDAANKWTAGTVNGSSLAFTYNGLGRRTSYEADGAYSDYWYDRTGLTEASGSKASNYLRDPDRLLLSRTSGASLANYGRDILGSVTMLTRPTQSVGATIRYDAWGKVISQDGSAYTLFGYAGAPLDPASGLSMMGQRYYQPASGRFTQPDPLPASILSVNRYAYAGCNPVNFTDPTGLHPEGPQPRCTRAETFFAGLALFSTGLALIGSLASIPVTGPVGTALTISIIGNAAGTFGSLGYLMYCLGED